MRTIEVFADVRCPFTHVSLRRFAPRRDEVGACEREQFQEMDWYPRYGMVYYNFLKDRYTRK